MDFFNCYEDSRRAEAYAKLEFPGTYYLAYRDLPQIIFEHVGGRHALDFGCGTGRSTSFLKKQGFDAIGVDISEDMLKKAREIDPQGDYRLMRDGDFGSFEIHAFDLVLSIFTFDNIPTMEKKARLFGEMGRLLKVDGRIVNLVEKAAISRRVAILKIRYATIKNMSDRQNPGTAMITGASSGLGETFARRLAAPLKDS